MSYWRIAQHDFDRIHSSMAEKRLLLDREFSMSGLSKRLFVLLRQKSIDVVSLSLCLEGNGLAMGGMQLHGKCI